MSTSKIGILIINVKKLMWTSNKTLLEFQIFFSTFYCPSVTPAASYHNRCHVGKEMFLNTYYVMGEKNHKELSYKKLQIAGFSLSQSFLDRRSANSLMPKDSHALVWKVCTFLVGIGEYKNSWVNFPNT